MIADKEVQIFLSKKKLTKMIVFCVLFMGGGIFMLLTDTTESTLGILNIPVIKNGIAIMAIVLGPIGIYYFIKKWRTGGPALIINKEGVIDNTTQFKAGLISWTDIDEVKTKKMFNQQHLLLMMRDPQGYIIQQDRPTARKAMQMNYKNYGTPVIFSANTLNCSFNELKTMLEERLYEYKQDRK